MRVLSWNLFHGRDAPPDPGLHTWRSRLLRTAERNSTHVQVNRPLLAEFSSVLDREEWTIAFLQEAPPRWLRPLCRHTGASGASALTSRNLGAAARAWMADRNPDLIASNEGGSNQLLVRPPWRVAATRRLTLTLLPERRRMLWSRLERPDGKALAVANVHLSAGRRPSAERELRVAADQAVRWSGGLPLVFGGDLNLRPEQSAPAFAELAERHGLTGVTPGRAIDHLLTTGLEVLEPVRRLDPERHEVPSGEAGLAIRLSDHAPVAGTFGLPSTAGRQSR